MSNKQYIIVDIINQEFFKNVNGETKVFSNREDAELHCGIYELENAWVCKLITNYIEPKGVKKMKLYTKEEFLKAAEFCEVSMIDAKYIIERIDEVTDPIELPSDEEINHQSESMFENTIEMYEEGFVDGAKYVIDKIKGGKS